MPINLYLPKNAEHSGICVTWIKTAQRIDIYGWYDGFVGIEGDSMSLKGFFNKLGITKKDCERAFGDDSHASNP